MASHNINLDDLSDKALLRAASSELLELKMTLYPQLQPWLRRPFLGILLAISGILVLLAARWHPWKPTALILTAMQGANPWKQRAVLISLALCISFAGYVIYRLTELAKGRYRRWFDFPLIVVGISIAGLALYLSFLSVREFNDIAGGIVAGLSPPLLIIVVVILDDVLAKLYPLGAILVQWFRSLPRKSATDVFRRMYPTSSDVQASLAATQRAALSAEEPDVISTVVAKGG